MTELINKYKNGKVYKIEPIIDHDEEDIYIGSTCQPYLSSRMNQHRQQYLKKINKCNVILLFDKYGVENCNIILIESIEANNKMELHQREAHFIKTLKCINRCVPLRTDKEYYEDNKDKIQEYRKLHKNERKEYDKIYKQLNEENLKIKNKQYMENHKKEKQKYDKKYRETNKNIVKNKKKEYYEANKEAINAKRRELYQLKKQEEQII